MCINLNDHFIHGFCGAKSSEEISTGNCIDQLHLKSAAVEVFKHKGNIYRCLAVTSMVPPVRHCCPFRIS